MANEAYFAWKPLERQKKFPAYTRIETVIEITPVEWSQYAPSITNVNNILIDAQLGAKKRYEKKWN